MHDHTPCIGGAASNKRGITDSKCFLQNILCSVLSPPAISSDNLIVTATAHSPPPDRDSAWTIPLLCAGIAIIGCCMLIPAADENRRLLYERQKLQMDLDHIQKQMALYDEFLKGITTEPNLSERLAQRQMGLVRDGTRVLKMNGESAERDISPYELVTLAPPPPQPAYQPTGGRFAALCREPRPQLFMMGAGMLLVAIGLVMGAADPTSF